MVQLLGNICINATVTHFQILPSECTQLIPAKPPSTNGSKWGIHQDIKRQVVSLEIFLPKFADLISIETETICV